MKMKIQRIENKIYKIETKSEIRGRKRVRSSEQNLENEDTKKRKEIKAKPNGKGHDQSEEIENREKIRRMKEESKIEQSEDIKYRIRIKSAKTKSGEIRTKNKNFLEKTELQKNKITKYFNFNSIPTENKGPKKVQRCFCAMLICRKKLTTIIYFHNSLP